MPFRTFGLAAREPEPPARSARSRHDHADGHWPRRDGRVASQGCRVCGRNVSVQLHPSALLDHLSRSDSLLVDALREWLTSSVRNHATHAHCPSTLPAWTAVLKMGRPWLLKHAKVPPTSDSVPENSTSKESTMSRSRLIDN